MDFASGQFRTVFPLTINRLSRIETSTSIIRLFDIRIYLFNVQVVLNHPDHSQDIHSIGDLKEYYQVNFCIGSTFIGGHVSCRDKMR